MTLLLTNKLDHVPTPKIKGVFFKEKKAKNNVNSCVSTVILKS